MTFFDDFFKAYKKLFSEKNVTPSSSHPAKNPPRKTSLPPAIKEQYAIRHKNEMETMRKAYNDKLRAIENVEKLKQIVKDSKKHSLDEKFHYINKYLKNAESYESLRQERWCDNVHCPKCKSKKITQISSQEHNRDNYRYKCHDCSYEFNDDSDTPLETQQPSIQTWMKCWYLLGCTESVHIIADKLGLNEQVVKEMIQVLQKVFGASKPFKKLQLKPEELKEFKFYEEKLKEAFMAKHDLLLGKEAISNPLDTAEDRKQRDRRTAKEKEKPRGPNKKF